MTNGYPPSGGEGQPPQDGQAGRPQYPQQGPPPAQGGHPQHPPQQGGYGQYPQGPAPGARGPSGPRASFGQRLGAYLLDVVIVIIPFLIIVALLGGFDADNFDADTGRVEEGILAEGAVFATLLGLVLSMGYFTFLEGGASGQTIGKKALGIRVIRQETGGTVGYARALARNAVRSLPGLIRFLSVLWTLLDGLWMLWDRENQTLHDKAARTLVVPVAAYPIHAAEGLGQHQSYGPPQGYPGQGPPPGEDHPNP